MRVHFLTLLQNLLFTHPEEKGGSEEDEQLKNRETGTT